MNRERLAAGDRIARDKGHRIDAWRLNSPLPGRAYAMCQDCNGTIEIREDGTFTGPVVHWDCPTLTRAIAEQREGISDYYSEGE